MIKFKKFNTDIIILIISIVSFMWLILYKVVFINFEAPYEFLFEIGTIFFGIFGSILASGIFYFFVVYLEKRRKQKIIDKIVDTKLRSISVGLFIIKKDVFPIIGLKFSDDIPSLEYFTKICKGIDLRKTAPNIPNTTNKPITWFEYFSYFFQSDRHNSERLYKHIIYLDIELVELLDDIQYSHFERALDSFYENAYTYDISGAPGPFWIYLKNLENIKKYNEIKNHT